MRLTSIGTVAASRVPTFKGKKVTVEIGKPRKFRGAPDYYCPLRIRGLGDDFISCSGGVDSVQALELAFTLVGARLYYSEEAKSGMLTRDAGAVKGDLGFPLMETAEKGVLPERSHPSTARRGD